MSTHRPDIVRADRDRLRLAIERTKTIVGYLYRDEHYCPDCIGAEVDRAWPNLIEFAGDPESELDALATTIGFRRSREGSLSQRDFPHTITSGQLDEPAPLCETCRTEIR